MIEVRTRRGWRPLTGSGEPPAVGETDTIELRQVSGRSVLVGGVVVAADTAGTAAIRPADHRELNGHIGLLDVHDHERRQIGEIDIRPGKLSEPSYEVLRADLQRTWTGLVFDQAGVTSLMARPPSAAELLQRIERPLRQIIDQPSERLLVDAAVRRLDRVRHPRELRPSVVRAGARGQAARTQVLVRSHDTPERDLVIDTLHLLRQHARNDTQGGSTVRRIDQLLAGPFSGLTRRPISALTWGMRSDPRYRQVLEVHRTLTRLDLHATEGPGELRLGVRGLIRLYEYWVFLQVLLAAREQYGEPLAPGFDMLSVPQRGGSRRLELAAGTTVEFPGGVHVAFEPSIDTAGRGWMGIEYVPHPDPEKALQQRATPDVAVLRAGGVPRLTIFDAKYVGRHHVEPHAARLHQKYARMRLRGRPIVDFVYAAHPHRGYEADWAGYGHIALTPGYDNVVPLPHLVRAAVVPEREPEPATHSVTVVADQYWMHEVLAGRRIDLRLLAAVAGGTRPVANAVIVMPDIAQLRGFAAAAEYAGWAVRSAESVERRAQIDALVTIVEEFLADGPVVVISGDADLASRLPSDDVEVFDAVAALPDL